MRFAGVGTILAMAAALGSCGEKPPEAQATPEPALASVAGLALGEARVQMPVVQGRPGVAYFTLSQSSGAPRKIVGVSVDLVGRTEMHRSMGGAGMATMAPVEDVPIAPGQSLRFEPGGYHVMLFDIDPGLRFAKQVKLGVGLDDGSSVEARATVTTVMEDAN